MDSGMVEENGNSSLDQMAGPTATSADNGSSTTVLTSSGANIVQLIPSTGSTIQVSNILYHTNISMCVCVYFYFISVSYVFDMTVLV